MHWVVTQWWNFQNKIIKQLKDKVQDRRDYLKKKKQPLLYLTMFLAIKNVGWSCHFVRSVLGARKVPEFELREFSELERLFQLPKGSLFGNLPQKLWFIFFRWFCQGAIVRLWNEQDQLMITIPPLHWWLM